MIRKDDQESGKEYDKQGDQQEYDRDMISKVTSNMTKKRTKM